MDTAGPAFVVSAEVQVAWAVEREAWADLMTPTVDVLTQAARLTRTLAGGQVEREDFADFLAKALASVAANLGRPGLVTAGRPSSWEADLVDQLVFGTVGDDPDELIQFRTEPVVVPLNVAQLVVDTGCLLSFADAEVDLPFVPDDPAAGEEAWERLRADYFNVYTGYAAAFTRAVQAYALTIDGLTTPAAGDVPQLRVPVLVLEATDPEEPCGQVQNPDEWEGDPLVWRLWSHALDSVGLPQLTTDYPQAG